MSNRILITDSLFIKEEHARKLTDAGFEVERLDKPAATEDELCAAVKGKAGYILGGVEKVTKKVIESADQLKAIVFTGTAWDGFIPGHELATQKGIAIGAAPHLNAYAVAEFGFATTLLMTRDLIGLQRGGNKTFETTKSLPDLKIGIVGLGHIGRQYAQMVRGAGAKRLFYYNRSSRPEFEKELDIKALDKDQLFATCDVIFVALHVGAGKHYIDRDDINAMKSNSLLVSIADPLLFDLDALHARLVKDEIRGAFDENIKEERFTKLPLDIWYTPNESSAFNTGRTVQEVSDSCVDTMINLLNTGEDKYLMNPDYRK